MLTPQWANVTLPYGEAQVMIHHYSYFNSITINHNEHIECLEQVFSTIRSSIGYQHAIPNPHLPRSLHSERREYFSHIINKNVFGILILNENMDAINSCCLWWRWRDWQIILMLFDDFKLRIFVWGLFVAGVCSITFWCHCYTNGTKAKLIFTDGI